MVLDDTGRIIFASEAMEAIFRMRTIDFMA